MTTVDIPPKIHKKLKKEAVRRDMDLKEVIAEKLSFIVIAVILVGGGLGLAYAIEVDLPLDEPYDDSFCSFLAANNYVKFTCDWRWFLPDYIMDKLREDTTIPGLISEVPQHNIDLADKIKLLLEKGSPPVEPTIDDSIIVDDEPDVPLTTEERQIDDSIKKLDECLRGLGAWAAYQDQTEIKYFIDQSRWQFADRDNLSQNIPVLRILKAIEECNIMRTYERMHLIGAYELNKVLADLADVDYLGRPSAHPLESKVTDQSDSMVATDPVTPKDIADEREDMERLLDDLIKARVFKDPDAPLTGENRGGQPLGLQCQMHGQPAPLFEEVENVCPLSKYDAHILKNWDSITYSDILQLQCDNFLYIYQHKIGTHEFPVWLNHCVPKVVREG